jgi:hypothetical protein
MGGDRCSAENRDRDLKFRSQESEKRRIEKQPWKLMIELRDEAMMQR